MLKETTI